MVGLVISSGFVLKFLQNHYRDRPLNMRGRNQAPIRSPRSNGRVMTPPETNFPERSSRELALAPVQIHVHQGGAKAAHSDPYHSSSPEKKAQLNANGSVHMLERVVEFGSVGHLPYGPPPLESSRQPNAGSSLGQNSSASVPSPRTPKPKSALGADQDRYDTVTKLLLFIVCKICGILF